MTKQEKPRFTFDPKEHKYYFDGVWVPNTSWLLQKYGISDMSGIPLRRLAEKREIGIAVHKATEYIDEGKFPTSELPQEIKPYVDAYMKFREVTGFEPRFSEIPLYSAAWNFATTLDRQGKFVWENKEIEAIIDLKCTWSIYDSVGPQIASHKIAFEENHHDIKIDKRFALQLKENGNYEVHLLDDPNDRNVFLSCVNIHNWRVKHGLFKAEEIDNGK